MEATSLGCERGSDGNAPSALEAGTEAVFAAMFPHDAIFTFLSYIASDVLPAPAADVKGDANGYALYGEMKSRYAQRTWSH